MFVIFVHKFERMHKRTRSEEVQTQEPYSGEQECGVEDCKQKAIFMVSSKIVCSIHSLSAKRRKLEKNPKSEKETLYDARARKIKMVSLKNKAESKRGDVIVSRMEKGGRFVRRDGYLSVFPGFGDSKRRDGFVANNLSLESLGPVRHGQAGLPVCKNIKNYHQYNLIYDDEVDENGDLVPSFYKLQKRGYINILPKQCKFDQLKMAEKGDTYKPISYLHDHKRYTLVEARQFYCEQYEKLVVETGEFKQLKQMVNDGTNMMIVGYGGYPVTKEELCECYADPTREFSQELLLFSMLVIDDPFDYPWNVWMAAKEDLFNIPDYVR